MIPIRGNRSLLKSLKKDVESGHVSNGYIFNGPDGSGKMLIADRFAAMLQCTGDGDRKPCGMCMSCLQWQTKNQPDIIYVTHEKTKITVDDIREKINRNVSIKPYNGPYKIYIVDEAEKMNVQAQNALLKTLEEPPEYAVIMLLSNNADSFLDTIRSRCIKLLVEPVSSLEVREAMQEREFSEEQIEASVPLSGGAIGRAFYLAESEVYREMYQTLVSFLRNIRRTDTASILRLCSDMSQFKSEIQEEFDFLRLWFRDVFVYKTGHDISLLMMQGEKRYIAEISENISFSGIEKINRAVDEAQERLQSNVNFDMTQELLFMTIREQIR